MSEPKRMSDERYNELGRTTQIWGPLASELMSELGWMRLDREQDHKLMAELIDAMPRCGAGLDPGDGVCTKHATKMVRGRHGKYEHCDEHAAECVASDEYTNSGDLEYAPELRAMIERVERRQPRATTINVRIPTPAKHITCSIAFDLNEENDA